MQYLTMSDGKVIQDRTDIKISTRHSILKYPQKEKLV